ncbi:MAG: DNA-3-methyladenine glycosylase 2 family protein [Chloroflexota bacterium]|nr:DNA-3-methyladenine glycosylase 2 family protein [Chloroflexota bacterium]
MASVVLDVPVDLDLRRTLAPLAHGTGDPTIRFATDGTWRATRTNAGSATLHLTATAGSVTAQAWGAGAEEALRLLPGLLGLEDDPRQLVPRHRVVRELARRFAGVRLPRTGRRFEALLPAILEQKVTGVEARRSYRELIRRYGEPAPGPAPLRLAPQPATLAGLPYHAYHPLGLERRRSEVIRRAAALAARLETAAPNDARRLLAAIPGIGPWTIAEVLRVADGDPDAISVGDFHLPHLVGWALAGEARADDRRMLELLEPYRGQRARVQRLLELAGVAPPRRGPRMASRQIARL